VFAAFIAAFFVSFAVIHGAAADSKALSQTSLGKEPRACKPQAKAAKPSSSAREQARLLKPVFAMLSKRLAESPLQSLCDQMPDFACWPDGIFPRGEIDLYRAGKGKFLLRVPCTQSAYNATSFFVAATTDVTAPVRQTVTKKKLKPTKTSATTPASLVTNGPMLVLFPTHPDFQNVPQFQAWGLKPLEAIVGYRDYEPAKRRITAYTKGLGDGTFGHFHQYEIPTATLIPRLQVSIAKTELDSKDPFHYERGQMPPFVKTWIRMPTEKVGNGCLADFQDLQCRVFKK
jgi:hypothetical protein